jgi:predicted ATP-dependent endonuclease of OLD family
MAFTKFVIKNFKCFQDEQSLTFSQPKEGFWGSGITYIVGANNSGKTTLIEGLSIKHGHKIKSSERIDGVDPEFCLYEGNFLKKKCVLVRPESYTIKSEPSLTSNEIFEIISSRRHWGSNAGSTYTQIGDSIRSSYEFQNRQNSIDVASELKTIESNESSYQNFIKLVRRVIPEFTKFAVGYEDHEFIEYISGANVRHKTDLLGDGVITAIRILLQLYIAKSNPLIIDEPELSLHPAAQRKLLNVIAEYSEKRQIIISTHSPYLISWKCLQNGAVINRVVKIEDKNSKIYSVSDFQKYASLINSANWQQPYLLDEVAKEIFFTEDNILFLEGQEDVGLLRLENLSEKINIFGYGVRGKNNFEFALKLVKDLGYRKVCCVLDNGESENLIKSSLEASFSPDYKVVQWEKSDIRDKRACLLQEKDGYFTESGIKKKNEELGDFDKKIAMINQYFENNELKAS